ncbi:MAG: D-glycero-alpha-D-manno-heptose-1,7-bisphosphate 7-phosphatase [Aureispira sp.]
MAYKNLFLDRDGVINRRIVGNYVRHWEEWHFLENVQAALAILAQKFDRIVIVTNQQGVAKGVMTAQELEQLHEQMLQQIQHTGGRIDKVYACMEHERDNPYHRKPNAGMAIQAQADFPAINFEESIMVGDSVSDLVFGQQLGMRTVLITTKPDLDRIAYKAVKDRVWAKFPSLWAFSQAVT